MPVDHESISRASEFLHSTRRHCSLDDGDKGRLSQSCSQFRARLVSLSLLRIGNVTSNKILKMKNYYGKYITYKKISQTSH